MREKSDENWRVGTECLENGDLNVACSRIYYAVFQAALAWARTKKGFADTSGSVHSAICRLISREGGAARVRDCRTYSQLQGLRLTADYQPDPPSGAMLERLLLASDTMRQEYLKKAQ